jgi:hypothetical protein
MSRDVRLCEGGASREKRRSGGGAYGGECDIPGGVRWLGYGNGAAGSDGGEGVVN